MDFNQSEKLLGKLIAVMIIAIVLVVSISLLKFMGVFSLIGADNSENTIDYYPSDTAYETTYETGSQEIAETPSTSSVTEIDSRTASDSRFFGTPWDIRGLVPPEELGYPIYNRIFENSLSFRYSTYSYEVNLVDNPFIISYTVDPFFPSVTVDDDDDSVNSGDPELGKYGSDDDEDYVVEGGGDEDEPEGIYPEGSPYECFLKITVTDLDTDEIIYDCGYSGEYPSNLYQWHLIPDFIERARVDFEGNYVNLDLEFGAGRCEDLNSTMIMYRGLEEELSERGQNVGDEEDYEEPEVWWY